MILKSLIWIRIWKNKFMVINKKKKTKDYGFFAVVVSFLFLIIISMLFMGFPKKDIKINQNLKVRQVAKFKIDHQKVIDNSSSQDVSVLIQNIKEKNNRMDMDDFNNNEASNVLRNFLMGLRFVFN